MRPLTLFAQRTTLNLLRSRLHLPPSSSLCTNGFHSDDDDSSTPNRNPNPKKSDFDPTFDDSLLGLPPIEDQNEFFDEFTPRRRFLKGVKLEAEKIFQILREDGPGINVVTSLGELNPKISSALVREVLLLILMSINAANKSRCARLASKFFFWSGQQAGYKHTTNAYNLTIKIFAETDSYKQMWRLVDEMTYSGLAITAYTFHILISTCEVAGMARKIVERFLMSKDFNYRPFKHSFNAILYLLLTAKQFRLIEWVYQKMLLEHHSPDVLTYNVVMRAKLRLGKSDEFHRLVAEMGNREIVPDLHTYNLLLHMLGKANNVRVANELLDGMDQAGCHPSVLHFTTLIDGLGRAGNLDACKHFFDMMIDRGCKPDVVCYTVMINGYLVGGEFEKAHELFDDMLVNGQLPNVYTYNSMIRGLCVVEKFDEACNMLKSMNNRGCTPNFSVYSTLVSRLRNAGRASQANDIISYMVEKGHYLHLLFKFGRYRRY